MPAGDGLADGWHGVHAVEVIFLDLLADAVQQFTCPGVRTVLAVVDHVPRGWQFDELQRGVSVPLEREHDKAERVGVELRDLVGEL